MHGRVKVRTSEEEKIRKLKERQEKLKQFQHAMKKIQNKRQNGELDKELLEITGQVLTSNPDIYTLWNIRREILNSFVSAQVEDLSKLFDDELTITEYCLKVNPKSYCAWHQREWVLMTRTDPDWKNELALCEKYLKLDERNFHTWDYRRFVVSQYKPSLKDEFNFTTEKIHDNFSNYSAWHYRSKMLVELYPDLDAGRPIEDSHHKHELELVQSAAFTDPDDTSAWFYQRWLLGAVKQTTQLVVCTVSPTKITVAFNRSIPLDSVSSQTIIFIQNVPLKAEWRSCSGNQYDTLWICESDVEVTDGMDVKVEFQISSESKQVVQCQKQCYGLIYIGKAKVSFQNQYSEPVVEELKKQLVACRQLLELEPDNRWTLLTTTVFLHCIDAQLYHEEVIKNLKSLKDLDKLRAGYYNDLITKWSIEWQITKDYNQNSDGVLKIKFDEKIASLPHLQYYSYCSVVDLSDQNLTNRILPALGVLQHCKVLCLANNKISSLCGFPNLTLHQLNLKNNMFLDKDKIKLFSEKVSYDVIY